MKLLKLIIFHLIIFGLPLAIVGVGIYKAVYSEALTRYKDRVDSLASIQKARVEEIVDDYERELDLLTSRRQFRLTVQGYIDSKTQENLIQFNRVLQDMQYAGSYAHVSVVGTNGVVLASTRKDSIGQDVSAQSYFIDAKEKNVVHYLSKDYAGEVYANLAGPLVLDNRTLGVLVAERNAKDLYKIFRDHIGLGLSGEWGMATHAPNGDALIIVPGRFDTNPRAALESALPQGAVDAPLTHALRGHEGVWDTTVDYRGSAVIAATRYIPEVDWGIGVKVNKSEVLEPLVRLRQLLLACAIILFAACVITSMYSMRVLKK
ncbi:MAG: cache domain-containing protein [Candidatus Doudnabacteria bacterium]|nr:cache domain-containing protein [Candidatus Doudnabacteria bacterium]